MQSILTEIKSILSRNLFYCNVGARGGIESPWLSFRNILNLISFEPDKEAFDLLLNE